MRRRIAWKNKVTGFTSCGEWQNWDADTAKEIAERANLEFPIINHWVEDESEYIKSISQLSGEPSDSDAVVNLYRP